MNDSSHAMDAFINALYTRFLMRDFIGKIVPGCIFLWCLRTVPFAECLMERFPEWDWRWDHPGSIAVWAGGAWIASIVLQGFGEVVRLPFADKRERFLVFWPAEYSDARARYELRQRFMRQSDVWERHQEERFAVIAQAAGIAACSLMISALVVAFAGIALAVSVGMCSPEESCVRREVLQKAFACLFLMSLSLILRRVHRMHVEKRYHWIETLLRLVSTG